jgi:hypothetical protein
VPGALELGPHRRVVVDLAVERDPDRLVLVGERLMPAGEIDDAQAAVRESGDASACNPAPSGPRCVSTSRIRTARARSSGAARRWRRYRQSRTTSGDPQDGVFERLVGGSVAVNEFTEPELEHEQ